MKKRPKAKFSNECLEFIEANYKGIDNKTLTRMVNEKFNTSYDWQQVKYIKIKYGWVSGVRGGELNVGKNTGKVSKERYEKMKKTMFKKGYEPKHKKPIGAEVKGKYTFVKMSDGKYKLKHHLVWEQHNGEIPKGHMIIFADGDKTNYNIENLLCVTKQELTMINRYYKIHADADLTKTSLLLAKIRLKIAERKKNE